MYGKIFSDIFDSSITQYSGETIYTFMCLIVLADSEGYVRLNPMALANRIRIPVESVMQAIKNLEAPDPHSSSAEYEGRRIIPLSEITEGQENRGWWIVTHKKWRETARRLDQTLKTRQRVQKYREKTNKIIDVTPCNGVKRVVTTAEAETIHIHKKAKEGSLRETKAANTLLLEKVEDKEKEKFLLHKDYLKAQCEILINAFKNKENSQGFDPLKFIESAVKSKIPVIIYKKVIDSMVKQRDKIKNPIAWIITVLKEEEQGHHYAEALKKHYEIKNEKF